MSLEKFQPPLEKIAEFCRKWRVREFALFGSVLREDFRPDSDIDVLVAFEEAAVVSLFDLVRMQDELEEIFGRSVDLLTRRSIEQSRNPWRREEILGSAKTIYAA